MFVDGAEACAILSLARPVFIKESDPATSMVLKIHTVTRNDFLIVLFIIYLQWFYFFGEQHGVPRFAASLFFKIRI